VLHRRQCSDRTADRPAEGRGRTKKLSVRSLRSRRAPTAGSAPQPPPDLSVRYLRGQFKLARTSLVVKSTLVGTMPAQARPQPTLPGRPRGIRSSRSNWQEGVFETPAERPPAVGGVDHLGGHADLDITKSCAASHIGQHPIERIAEAPPAVASQSFLV
jgi:hypothetical protein